MPQIETHLDEGGEPLVLPGALEGSPALGWNLERLAALDPSRKVPLMLYRTGNPFDVKDRIEASGRLGDFVRMLDEAPPRGDAYPYLVCSLERLLPELLPDLCLPFFPDRGRQLDFDLFAGKDAVAGAHFHAASHALICQIQGEKRIVVHPPSDSRFLYPYPIYEPYYCFSRARFDDSHRDEFPLLAQAHPREATLRPGDAFLVPAHFWHTVYGMGRTLSVTYFWRARLRHHWRARPGVRNAAGLLLDRSLYRFWPWPSRRDEVSE